MAKVKFDYTKSTFYVSLVILMVVLFMASPYLTSFGKFQQGQTLPVITPVCGNGVVEGNEVCDNDTVDCSSVGAYFAGDSTTCLSNCLGYDVSTCYSAQGEVDQVSWWGQAGSAMGTPAAQTFTAGMDGRLAYVDVQIYAFGCSAKKASLEIRTTSNGLPTNTVLAAQTIDVPGLPAVVKANFTEDNLSLTEDTMYAIYLSCGAWDFSYMPSIGGADYLGGVGYHKVGNAWNAVGDFDFRTYMMVTGNNPPYATFTYDITNKTASFDSSQSYDPEGTGLTYAWEFGDGAVSTQANPIHTYRMGDYTVKLTVTDNPAGNKNPQNSSYQEDISVQNIGPTAVFTTDRSTAYVDQAIVFDASSSFDTDGTIASYAWTFGDEVGINPPHTNPTTMAITPGPTLPVVPQYIAYHSYENPGTYTATLTVTDDSGATNTATAQVTIQPVPEPVPIGTITVSAGSDKTITVGDTASFTGTVFCSEEPCNPVTLYEWDFQNDTIIDWNATAGGNITTVTHTYGTVGTYAAMFRVTDNESNQYLDYAIVNVLPIPETPVTGPVSGPGGIEVPQLPKLPGQEGLIKNQSVTVPPSQFGGNETGTPAAQAGEQNKQPVSILLVDALIVLLFVGALAYIVLRTRVKLGKKENINKTDTE